MKIYRQVRTQSCDPLDALKNCLTDYQNPIPPEVMQFQINLAVHEASDLEFVPLEFRPRSAAPVPETATEPAPNETSTPTPSTEPTPTPITTASGRKKGQ